MSDAAPGELPHDPPDLESEWSARYLHGLRCFDAGDFHEAHEQIEEVWSGEVGARRHLLQALIQLAVALHHRDRFNFGGALTLCERAQEHLAAVTGETCFIDPKALAERITAIEREIIAQRMAPAPTFAAELVPDFSPVRARIEAGRRSRGLAAFD